MDLLFLLRLVLFWEIVFLLAPTSFCSYSFLFVSLSAPVMLGVWSWGGEARKWVVVIYKWIQTCRHKWPCQFYVNSSMHLLRISLKRGYPWGRNLPDNLRSCREVTWIFPTAFIILTADWRSGIQIKQKSFLYRLYIY